MREDFNDPKNRVRCGNGNWKMQLNSDFQFWGLKSCTGRPNMKREAKPSHSLHFSLKKRIFMHFSLVLKF